MSALEFRLLNEFQRELPLCPAPYAAMARKLGVDETTVIDTLARLAHAGKVSRVGAVFRPHDEGSATVSGRSGTDRQHMPWREPQLCANAPLESVVRRGRSK
jgi:DNA-binding Lrp family transcriptional regulator